MIIGVVGLVFIFLLLWICFVGLCADIHIDQGVVCLDQRKAG